MCFGADQKRQSADPAKHILSEYRKTAIYRIPKKGSLFGVVVTKSYISSQAQYSYSRLTRSGSQPAKVHKPKLSLNTLTRNSGKKLAEEQGQQQEYQLGGGELDRSTQVTRRASKKRQMRSLPTRPSYYYYKASQT
ncbi:uncharacterized protein TRUGW13939_05918 [Talaromyces rugulosus]|uniref:Uncharacterized protein n=1 Tax=Talaromyces rugulosus TaxID=121627 RepID=A0A7H8QZE8_TALRU|nr:uncharacterized protein TRUGW13939_05918 [Talaromyces rugulosus]QKX58791.1 hypothetical protein TRUGW13939_05918 [Talaromyces rugulosus]